MATVPVLIKSSGGGASSMASFEVLIPANTSDLYVGTYGENYISDIATVTWNVANSFNMQHSCTVPLEFRHNKTPNSGARIAVSGLCIDIRTNNITIDGIETVSNGVSNGIRIVTPATGVTVTRCLVRSIHATNTNPPLYVHSLGAGGDCDIRHNHIIQNSGSSGRVCGSGNLGADRTVRWYHNTGLANNNPANVWTQFSVGTGAHIAIGNKILSDGVGALQVSYGGTFDASSDYNVGSDTTAPGTNSKDNAAEADHITTITIGAEDMSVEPTLTFADFFEVLNTLAGELDSDGDELVTDYIDIGADQISTATAAGNGPGYLAKRFGSSRTGLRMLTTQI